MAMNVFTTLVGFGTIALLTPSQSYSGIMKTSTDIDQTCSVVNALNLKLTVAPEFRVQKISRTSLEDAAVLANIPESSGSVVRPRPLSSVRYGDLDPRGRVRSQPQSTGAKAGQKYYYGQDSDARLEGNRYYKNNHYLNAVSMETAMNASKSRKTRDVYKEFKKRGLYETDISESDSNSSKTSSSYSKRFRSLLSTLW